MTNFSAWLKSIRNIMREDSGVNGDAQRIEQLGWLLFFKVFSDKDLELELLSDSYRSPIPKDLRWDAWAADSAGITGEELLSFVNTRLFPGLRNLEVGPRDKRALLLRDAFRGNNNYMLNGTHLRRVLNKINEVDFNVSKDRHAFGDIYESILKELQSAGKAGEFYTPRAVTNFITHQLNPKLGEKVLDPATGTGGFLTAAIEHLKAQATTVEQRQAILQNVIGWELKPLPYLLAVTNLILHDVEEPNLRYQDSLSRPLKDYREKDRVDVILANPPFGGTVSEGSEKNFGSAFKTKESADLFLVLMVQLLKAGGRAGIVLPDGSLTGEGVKRRVREHLLQECNLHTIVRLPNSVFQPYATVATNLLFFTKGVPTQDIWYYEHRLPEGQKSYSKTKPIREEEFAPLKAWMEAPVESEIAWRVTRAELEARGYDLDIKNPNRLEQMAIHSADELLAMILQSMEKCKEIVERLSEVEQVAEFSEELEEIEAIRNNANLGLAKA